MKLPNRSSLGFERAEKFCTIHLERRKVSGRQITDSHSFALARNHSFMLSETINHQPLYQYGVEANMRFPDHPEFFERAVDLIRSRERCPFAQHKLNNGGIGADKVQPPRRPTLPVANNAILLLPRFNFVLVPKSLRIPSELCRCPFESIVKRKLTAIAWNFSCTTDSKLFVVLVHDDFHGSRTYITAAGILVHYPNFRFTIFVQVCYRKCLVNKVEIHVNVAVFYVVIHLPCLFNAVA